MKIATSKFTLELTYDEAFALHNMVNEVCIKYHPYLETSQKTQMMELSLLLQQAVNEKIPPVRDEACFKYIVKSKAEAEGKEG